MRITIDIDTGNAAFDDDDRNEEIGRIVRVISDMLVGGFTKSRVRDLNGNTVCQWESTDA